MTRDEYRRLRLTDMQARRWQTTRAMRNGNLEVPVGLEVEITGKHNGLTLKGAPCGCCGVSVFITRVDPNGVAEIP